MGGFCTPPRFPVTVLILVRAERQREGDETAPTSLDASRLLSLASPERAPPAGTCLHASEDQISSLSEASPAM